MALINCPECNKKISNKAISCPECGTPLSNENKKDLIKTTIKKEKTTIITTILYIIVFLTIITIVSSNLTFLKTIRTTLTLQQVQFSETYKGFISLYSSLITNITFIACILTILSKKYFKLSKILFIINNLISIVLYLYIYSLNLRVGPCFFILYFLNIIFLLLPRRNKLTETTEEIPPNQEEKMKKRNTNLQTLYNKKLLTKQNILKTMTIIIIEILFIIPIYIYNNKDIYKETIIQANSDFQIKITNNFINIRAKATTESKILGEVNKGDIYNVLDIQGGTNYIWYKIDYKGQIGYIASSREEPFVEELYNDKLIVNIFCTEENDDCAYLLEFITRYQKINDTFLINYLDIKDEHDNEVYNKLLTYYQDEPTIPYIIIGTNKVLGYKEQDQQTIIEVITEQQDNKTNLVDIIKKGNKLPDLQEEQKKEE